MGRTVRWLSLLMVLSMLVPATSQETNFLLSPQPDSRVQSEDLIVSATVSGPLQENMGLGRARLWVDDREVTSRCLRTDSYLSYRPLNTFEPGAVQLKLEFPNGVVRQWSFEVIPTQMITEVTHNAGKEALGQYHDLKVMMRGEPGVKATFSLGTNSKQHPMEEQSRGYYVGTYTVTPTDYDLGVHVVGHLHFGSRVESLKSEKPVSLFGHLFRVYVIGPPSGTKVPLNFPITGRTIPGSKVSVVPRVSFNHNTSPPTTGQQGASVSNGGVVGTGVGSIETKADENGYWKVDYGVPIKLPNINVVMSVFAVSPEGERSAPVTLRYRF